MIKKIKEINLKELGVFYALIVFWGIMFITNPYFGTWGNITSIMREAGFFGITAIGMTFVIASKAIDLSVGATLSLVGIICVLFVDRIGVLPTVLVSILVGGTIGLVNGLLSVRLRIPAFIATLGMLNVIRSIAYIITGGPPISTKNKDFVNIGNGSFIGIPIPFWILIIFTIIGMILMSRTRLGRYTLAVGNSEKAAYTAGIKTHKIRIWAMIILGVSTAFSGVMLSSRLWSANADIKTNYEFDIITIVVMSGCSLQGGKGDIFNTFISTIFYISISNAMNNYHVDPFWQYLIKGLILVAAFSLNSIRQIIVEKMQIHRIRIEQLSTKEEISHID